jgi:G:T-mismatch repair DNA endonuclease (very short patch repair protein)
MRFWGAKFDETVKRDKRNVEALRKLGWKVAIVWECSIKDEGPEAIAGRIAAWLPSGAAFKEFSSRKARAALRRISKRKICN